MKNGRDILCAWCMLRLYGSGTRFMKGLDVYTAFLHEGVARDMVIRLKFHGERYLAGILASLALDSWPEEPTRNDTVVPVPTSGKRKRERGYNQAALVASGIAKRTGASLKSILYRTPGDSQVGIGAEEREENVKGKFFCRGVIETGRVWLVDDVVTTGATLAENARVLRAAGMDDIVPAVVCYQSMNDSTILCDSEGVANGGF